MIPRPSSISRLIRRRPRVRAFTLIEVILATVLGVMVLTVALSVFVALQRSDRLNEQRLYATTELSVTQRSVELSLRTMILSDTPAPRQPASNPAGDATTPPVAPNPADRNIPDSPEPQFERPRVILSSAPGTQSMRWVDERGAVRLVDPQRLELTLERPPVFAEPDPGDPFVPVTHRMYANRGERERERRRREHEQQREDRRGGHSRQNSRQSERSSATPDAANPADASTDPTADSEPAIAAGVRGILEVTFEPDRPRAGDPINPEGGSWSLWWRTLPPLAATSGAQTPEGLSEEEILADPMYKPVRLASNLRWCRWEGVRNGETLTEFQATWWEDLPAYVTLEIQTVSGKWSKWMFEVQGTRGAEPGTESGPPPQPVGGAAAADQAQQIEDLARAVGGTPPAGAPTTTRNNTPGTTPTRNRTVPPSPAPTTTPSRPAARPSGGGRTGS